jgi:hypothetical protein
MRIRCNDSILIFSITRITWRWPFVWAETCDWKEYKINTSYQLLQTQVLFCSFLSRLPSTAVAWWRTICFRAVGYNLLPNLLTHASRLNWTNLKPKLRSKSRCVRRSVTVTVTVTVTVAIRLEVYRQTVRLCANPPRGSRPEIFFVTERMRS